MAHKPRIKPMLAMQLPIIFPRAIAFAPTIAAVIPTPASGREVPKPIMPTPINNGVSFIKKESFTETCISQSEAKTSRPIPRINIRMLIISSMEGCVYIKASHSSLMSSRSVFCYWHGTPIRRRLIGVRCPFSICCGKTSPFLVECFPAISRTTERQGFEPWVQLYTVQ